MRYRCPNFIKNMKKSYIQRSLFNKFPHYMIFANKVYDACDVGVEVATMSYNGDGMGVWGC